MHHSAQDDCLLYCSKNEREVFCVLLTCEVYKSFTYWHNEYCTHTNVEYRASYKMFLFTSRFLAKVQMKELPLIFIIELILL